MGYKYCILPSGNKNEFPDLDAELIFREIEAHYGEMVSGGRIYRISNDESGKLPIDENGPYLGDDNSGHSIYDVSVVALEQFNISDWVLIQ